MDIDSKNTERINNDQNKKSDDKRDKEKKLRNSDSKSSDHTSIKNDKNDKSELTDESKRDRDRDRKDKKRSRSRSRSRDRKNKKESRADSRDRRDRSRERSSRKSSKERSREKKSTDSRRDENSSKPRRRDDKVRKEEEDYVRRIEEQLEEEEVDEEKILEQKRKQREAILSKFSTKQEEKALEVSEETIQITDPIPVSIPISIPIAAPIPEVSEKASSRNDSPVPLPPLWNEPKIEPPLEAEPTSEFLAADYDDCETKKEEHTKTAQKLEISWAKLADDDSSDEDTQNKEKSENKMEQDDTEIDDSETFTLKADTTITENSKDSEVGEIEQTNNEANVFEKKNYVDDIFAPPEDDMFAQFDSSKKFLKKKSMNIEVVAPAGVDTFDDEEGYYKLRIGEMIGGRYRITSNLGKGVFSTVIKALDTKMNLEVAIKMIRNNETMYKAGQKELSILKKLNESDPFDKKHVVKVKDNFEHRKHLCIVFESLRMNLREVIRKFGKEVGLNIQAVKHYGIHLFMALDLLQSNNIIHADLKPDNVLVNDNLTQVKLADLGSASSTSENEITPYLVSRFYRAPEIILGLPYDCSIDVWSAGCTLYELYTGKILFPGSSNNQMLKYFMQVKGKFPNKMIRKGQFSAQHFDENYNFISVEKDKITNRDVTKKITFNQPTRELNTLLKDRSNMNEEDRIYLRRFIDLLDKCFQLNPEQRITAKEALKHPFFAKYKPIEKK